MRCGTPDRRDDDVGPTHLGGEVERARVRERHGRVDALAGEQQPERATDGDPAADDDDVRPAIGRRAAAAAR